MTRKKVDIKSFLYPAMRDLMAVRYDGVHRCPETMRIMLSISQFYCRGLIYQALLQAIHPLGLMNQTPTIEFILRRAAIFIAAPHDASLARKRIKIIATKAQRHQGFFFNKTFCVTLCLGVLVANFMVGKKNE